MSIESQVKSALDAATHENKYPHEYLRPAEEIVLEIHDWSGIAGFDQDNIVDVSAAMVAVEEWRKENPQPS
ncbi:hypothetical protein [Phaeobacter inhibens]|uniref:hypothetical protein n=1 Tax=Phaeobacter inhibens TaxID=221822 RepID=UPI000C9C2BAE|nr:hypothetical protein [Phaeobacter inhibens]AUQ54542.1 hypothetical protein PhaeoP92_01865 [Phaeobacter inhibens]AUQ78558.1 hypothetical protein PhaeoP74_01866 [Phaeobacter inhibens]AUR15717.1 hypothetical protein PhaeoP70_01864 [Phaeobacter inhibens]